MEVNNNNLWMNVRVNSNSALRTRLRCFRGCLIEYENFQLLKNSVIPRKYIGKWSRSSPNPTLQKSIRQPKRSLNQLLLKRKRISSSHFCSYFILIFLIQMKFFIFFSLSATRWKLNSKKKILFQFRAGNKK